HPVTIVSGLRSGGRSLPFRVSARQRSFKLLSDGASFQTPCRLRPCLTPATRLKGSPPGDRPIREDSHIKSASAKHRKVSGMRRAGPTADTTLPSFIDAAAALAPLVQASAEESERSRRLPTPLVEAMAQSGLFRLWIPRGIGGEESDPMTLVRVVEEISRADGAAGWCMAIAGGYGVFGGYLRKEAALEIYGSDPLV